jgi:uncharacterized membrane protein
LAAVRVGEEAAAVDFLAVAGVPEEEAQAEVGDMKSKEFISKLDEQKIVAAIGEAEKKTSGEIRVYISSKHRNEPLAAAQKRFEKLGMTKTRERNGVLIFIAPLSRKFAIVGDSGIHQKCGAGFWNEITEQMGSSFKEGRFSEAIVHAVGKVGAVLATYFPIGPDDRNELPDDILRD